MISAALVTLPDGRTFPQQAGKALSWSIGLHFTTADQQAGYPKTRAVIRAFAEHRTEDLRREKRELLKASFDRMFGHNARKLLALIEEEER